MVEEVSLLTDDHVRITNQTITIENEVYEVGEVVAVDIMSESNPRHKKYAWLSGALWAYLFLLTAVAYIFNDAFSSDGWITIALVLLGLLSFGNYLVVNMTSQEQRTCSWLLWSFMWTSFVGLLVIYVVVTFVTARLDDVSVTVLLSTCVGLTALNSVISIGLMMSQSNRNVYSLKLIGSFGARQLLASANERYIKYVAGFISEAIANKPLPSNGQ